METARLRDGDGNGNDVFATETVAVEATRTETRQEGGNRVVKQIVGELFSGRVVVIIITEELLIAGKER